MPIAADIRNLACNQQWDQKLISGQISDILQIQEFSQDQIL